MSRTTANLLLLLAAAIWGTAFVAQKLGAEHLGPMLFTGLRFLVGALVVLPLALREARRARWSRADWGGMAATGGALFCGAACQQIGIGMTTATNAGFLTALYVPLVPLIGLLALRMPPHPVVWPAAAGSLVGTWMLGGGGTVALAAGDLWVMVSAVFWALHVILVGSMAARTGAPVLVAAVQFLVCGALSTAVGLATEAADLAAVQAAGGAILYVGVLSVGIAFTLQVVGQHHAPASDAAVIISSESVFAAAAGALVLGERLTSLQLAGCALIMTCILAVQLLPGRRGAERAAEAG
ncbi:DMT family transporter [Arenibaculum pallidiluteum]|uniref:DMT family transporter n=1 Tax=Arenibaculum pallidiluteum TaxID=2812559 RepID=UPI001A96994F|nr:DMT family transporter [Arenibaculum pallidiluteum]